MSSMKTSVINHLWVESMRRDFNQFIKALDRTQAIQEEYLKRLLKQNVNTAFGKQHDFAHIKSIKDYQAQMPLTTYEYYKESIDSISRGRVNVLSTDKVRLFEPSSGSTSASKLIPYNKQLKREFNKGIAPWMYSLYKNNPTLFRGKAYWSISPSMQRDEKYGQIKIGFEDDSEYLGLLGRNLYNNISAVPVKIAKEKELNDFRNKTLAHLLLCEDLVFISVWNPTFLILLLEHLFLQYEQVLDIARSLTGRKDASRIAEIEKILLQGVSKSMFRVLWPKLSVVSCWTDGICKHQAEQLQSFFPNIKMQGKGLIATEAFMSLPLYENADPVIAVNSHFFEFIAEDTKQVVLAHELEVGKKYSVVVSTGAGFYRYQLGDIIDVTGFIKSAPTIRFISKADNISDLVGEKLNERHVKKCFELIFNKYAMNPVFYLLSPIKKDGEIRYCAFIQDSSITYERAEKLLIDFDTQLRKNFHYDYCRKLGQIEMLSLFKINSNGPETYHKEMLKREIRCGNIKPTCLDKIYDWDKYFLGTYMV